MDEKPPEDTPAPDTSKPLAESPRAVASAPMAQPAEAAVRPPKRGLLHLVFLLACLGAGVTSLLHGPYKPELDENQDEYELFSPVDVFTAGLRPDGVAVIRVDGAIMFEEPNFSGMKGADKLVNLLHKIAKASAVKAVVLRVNSPGGTVAASQEIAEAVRDVKRAGKKVVVSMADMAASGGYYISAPADWVIALPGTITGSIGVITQLPRYKKIADKVGYDIKNFTSGQFKDMGNPFRELGEAESDLFKKLVMDSYLQFVEEVAQGRASPMLARLAEDQEKDTWQDGLAKIRAGADDRPLQAVAVKGDTPADDADASGSGDGEEAGDADASGSSAVVETDGDASDADGSDGEASGSDTEAPNIESIAEAEMAQVRKRVSEIADGRIYTGAEAYRLGLVDQIGGIKDAIRKAGELAGLGPEPVLLRPKTGGDLGSFFKLFGQGPEGLGKLASELRLAAGLMPASAMPKTVPVAYMYLPGQ